MRLLRALSALWLASGALVAAKDDVGPVISQTSFDNDIRNLFIFDDSAVALGVDQDAGVVYRSTDSGAKWSSVGNIDNALRIYQHPRDNQVAVLIGKTRKHWITYDQGNSWRSFTIPDSLSYMLEDVSFHWSDSKRILFHTVEDFETAPSIGAVSIPRPRAPSNGKDN
jgi:photosystem II stability/assembly factor-like uncharacterized protein